MQKRNPGRWLFRRRDRGIACARCCQERAQCRLLGHHNHCCKLRRSPAASGRVHLQAAAAVCLFHVSIGSRCEELASDRAHVLCAVSQTWGAGSGGATMLDVSLWHGSPTEEIIPGHRRGKIVLTYVQPCSLTCVDNATDTRAFACCMPPSGQRLQECRPPCSCIVFC